MKSCSVVVATMYYAPNTRASHLDAGRGNDTIDLSMTGVSGVTVQFSSGDGLDSVLGGNSAGSLPARQENVARFGTNIEATSLRLVATPGDALKGNLFIAYGSGNDRIRIDLERRGEDVLRPFDHFEFSDGSRLSWEELAGRGVSYALPEGGNVPAIGTLLDDTILGAPVTIRSMVAWGVIAWMVVAGMIFAWRERCGHLCLCRRIWQGHHRQRRYGCTGNRCRYDPAGRYVASLASPVSSCRY